MSVAMSVEGGARVIAKGSLHCSMYYHSIRSKFPVLIFPNAPLVSLVPVFSKAFVSVRFLPRDGAAICVRPALR